MPIPPSRSAAPETTEADDRTLAYSTRRADRSCLVLLSIEALDPADGPCAPAGSAIGLPGLGGGQLGAVMGTPSGVTPSCRYGSTASPAHPVARRGPRSGGATASAP